MFYRDEAGDIFHTYSCFARGLDMMNAAYHYLDLTPLGRHEEGLPYPMDWVRLRDQYQPRRFRHPAAMLTRVKERVIPSDAKHEPGDPTIRGFDARASTE